MAHYLQAAGIAGPGPSGGAGEAALAPVSLAVAAVVQAALVLVASCGGGGPSFSCWG